jgi:hypothetical protein
MGKVIRLVTQYEDTEAERKLFFHILDITVLNRCTTLSSFDSKIDHQKLHLTLVQNLLEMSEKELHPKSSPRRATKSLKCTVWNPNIMETAQR